MKNPKSKQVKQPSLFFSLTWEFLNEYLPNQVGRSTATVESYRDSLTIFRRFLSKDRQIPLNKFRFSDCTKDCIFDFRDYLKQSGNKPSTINVRVAAVRSYLNYAADKDIAIQSIALSVSKIPPSKQVQEEKETLSEDALAAILAAPPQTKIGLRNRTILVTLYDSAVRISELLSVKLNDINLSTQYPSILFHGKGGKERWVQLTEKAVKHLNQYLQIFHANSPKDAYLFSTTIKGKVGMMSDGNVQRIIKQYADIARKTYPSMPPTVYPHMFRRTRATNLYQDGVPIELVSAILGHSSLQTTKDHYAKPSLRQIRDAQETVQTPTRGEEPLWIGNEDEMARMCGIR